MTTPAPTIDQTAIHSIQVVLSQFGQSVQDSIAALHQEIIAERVARVDLENHLKLLADAVQRSQAVEPTVASPNEDFVEALELVQRRLDANETKSERTTKGITDRLDRVVAEQHSTISTTVESAVNEVDRAVSERQEVIEKAIERLHERLNSFDKQAARMVEYFSDTAQELSHRIEQRPQAPSATSAVTSDHLEQLERARRDGEAALRRSTTEQIDDAMSAMNDRLVDAQGVVSDGTNQSLADIDAYVGRVSSGLDDAISMLSDRIAALDRRIDSLDTTATTAR